MEPLRFAPILRVSTEKQEQKGQSLAVQKSQIIDYVRILKGTIPESCWEYSGQEHATPDQERLKFDKLLADACRGIFDAVIVADASRWSRDNLKSKEAVKILKANGIRLFIGTMESDLYNPAQNLYLGMRVEIGEFQAREQALKSIMSQIHLAQRNCPSSGSLPYGRTFDKKTETWGVDPKKKAIIEQAAERYIKGERIKYVAASLGFKSSTNLREILKDRCGPNWTVSFRNDEVNVNELVTLTIPALLDEDTISRIHEVIRGSKSYLRGNKIKNDYLLNRMIFCANCGAPLNSTTCNDGKNQYYVHRKHEGLACRFTKYMHSQEIESAVLLELVKMFGDTNRIQKAIADAHPDMEKIERLKQEQENWIIELRKIASQKDKIIEKISKELITDEEARPQLLKLREQEAAIRNRQEIIDNILSSTPDPERVKKFSVFAGKLMSSIVKNTPDYILKKPFDYKRKIVENAFGGRDSLGHRLGVYMTETGDGWTFEIRGMFGNSLTTLPLTDDYLEEVFHLDPEYQDIEKELKAIRSETLRERGRG